MNDLKIAIEQAKVQNSIQDVANKFGWDSSECLALGGIEAFDAATEKHDKAFRKLDKGERRQYMKEVN